MRKLVASGSPFEREIGFSRAVRVGNIVEVAGTAPVGADAPGDVYAQTRRCLEIIAKELDLTMAFCGHRNLRDVDTRVLLPGTFPKP